MTAKGMTDFVRRISASMLSIPKNSVTKESGKNSTVATVKTVLVLIAVSHKKRFSDGGGIEKAVLQGCSLSLLFANAPLLNALKSSGEPYHIILGTKPSTCGVHVVDIYVGGTAHWYVESTLSVTHSLMLAFATSYRDLLMTRFACQRWARLSA